MPEQAATQLDWNTFVRSTPECAVIYLNSDTHYVNYYGRGDDEILWEASAQAAGFYENTKARHLGQKVILISWKDSHAPAGTPSTILGAYVGERLPQPGLHYRLVKVCESGVHFRRPRGHPSGCYVRGPELAALQR